MDIKKFMLIVLVVSLFLLTVGLVVNLKSINSQRVSKGIRVQEKNTIPVTNQCRVTGCSGQICAGEDKATTCEFREEYACYKSAKCEPQSDGQCGWTETTEYLKCVQGVGNNSPAIEILK